MLDNLESKLFYKRPYGEVLGVQVEVRPRLLRGDRDGDPPREGVPPRPGVTQVGVEVQLVGGGVQGGGEAGVGDVPRVHCRMGEMRCGVVYFLVS